MLYKIKNRPCMTETDISAVPLCLAQKQIYARLRPVTGDSRPSLRGGVVVCRFGGPLGGESRSPVPPCHTDPRLSLRTRRGAFPVFAFSYPIIIVRIPGIVKWVFQNIFKTLRQKERKEGDTNFPLTFLDFFLVDGLFFALFPPNLDGLVSGQLIPEIGGGLLLFLR